MNRWKIKNAPGLLLGVHDQFKPSCLLEQQLCLNEDSEGFWFEAPSLSMGPRGGLLAPTLATGTFTWALSKPLGAALAASWSSLAIITNWEGLPWTDADALQRSSPSKNTQVREGIGGATWIYVWIHVKHFDSKNFLTEQDRQTWILNLPLCKTTKTEDFGFMNCKTLFSHSNSSSKVTQLVSGQDCAQTCVIIHTELGKKCLSKALALSCFVMLKTRSNTNCWHRGRCPPLFPI